MKRERPASAGEPSGNQKRSKLVEQDKGSGLEQEGVVPPPALVPTSAPVQVQVPLPVSGYVPVPTLALALALASVSGTSARVPIAADAAGSEPSGESQAEHISMPLQSAVRL